MFLFNGQRFQYQRNETYIGIGLSTDYRTEYHKNACLAPSNVVHIRQFENAIFSVRANRFSATPRSKTTTERTRIKKNKNKASWETNSTNSIKLSNSLDFNGDLVLSRAGVKRRGRVLLRPVALYPLRGGLYSWNPKSDLCPTRVIDTSRVHIAIVDVSVTPRYRSRITFTCSGLEEQSRMTTSVPCLLMSWPLVSEKKHQ